MKTITSIKRIALTAVVMLTIGFGLVPHSDASVAPTNSGHSVTDPTFGGGGKDGNESHG
jgi:hypothetical protein